MSIITYRAGKSFRCSRHTRYSVPFRVPFVVYFDFELILNNVPTAHSRMRLLKLLPLIDFVCQRTCDRGLMVFNTRVV